MEHFGDELLQESGSTVFALEVQAPIRGEILDEKARPTAAGPDELRPISADVAILPRTHGTGLFQRGETQVLSVVTLGPDERGAEARHALARKSSKRFMHHYNFPPYSVGEVRRLGGTGRREIGHGALGERALEPVHPQRGRVPLHDPCRLRGARQQRQHLAGQHLRQHAWR